jgi:hypothetical protein
MSAGIETELFNGVISRFAVRWRKTVHLWFSVGAAVGAGCLILTMVYFLPSYIYTRFSAPKDEQVVDIQVIVRIGAHNPALKQLPPSQPLF